MKVLTNNQYYSQIANIIREQNGTSNAYTPPQMVRALKDLFYEEVEGVPPISFNGIGENLLDYRIDGASGGVGDKTSNLLQNTASSQTINGVTFTVNNDGSIICNGTSSAVTTFSISIKLNSNINYVLSGSPKNGGIETYRLDLRNISYSVYNNTADNGDGINFTVEENGTYLVCIRIAANYTCNNLTFYPMIRLASIQDDTYEPYGYKVPVVISRKNLLNTKLSTIQLGAGITFQKNNDGTVVVNGTPSKDFSLLAFPVYLTAARYVLSGCPESQDATKLRCDLRNSQYATVGGFDIGNAVRISVNSPGNYFFGIRVGAGYNCNNLKFYPMIRLSTIEDDTYEPYIEPTTTNIYLDEPIGANESISLSDTNVNIPTIRGTNVLSVDTTVQPSNVYIKSRHESSYETIMRERYEEAQAQLDALENGGE